jgi:cysteine desulfuration protein SufE
LKGQTPLMSIQEIADNFLVLDDWEDRYRYVIELGRGLAPLTDDEHAPQYKVRGCASQVWLVSERIGDAHPPVLRFRGDSDALIVRGLVGILIAMYSEQPADKIAALDAERIFADLGLKEHLTPQRSNGLASMVARIRFDAEQALKSGG